MSTRYRAEHRKEARAYAREWRKNNPDYYQKHPEQKLRRTALRHANPERHRKQNSDWYKRNFLKHLLIGAKSRAHRKGMDFSITLSDVVMPKICPVFGIELNVHTGGSERGRNRFDDSPSLDRIENSKGYVPGNVRVISWRANRLKQDGSADEHEKIAQYIRDNS